MKREFSAGGIVFNKAGQVLLIKVSGHEYWGFPKGNPYGNESFEETALREVKEEGGIEAEILNKIGDSKYVYTRNGEKTFKIVTLYLMKYKSGDTKDHDWEVSEATWFTPQEALETLSFVNDKELLKQALPIIEKELKK
jgi:8-oxo-dGTP pyrophosphatase MutT (NUDIX family)